MINWKRWVLISLTSDRPLFETTGLGFWCLTGIKQPRTSQSSRRVSFALVYTSESRRVSSGSKTAPDSAPHCNIMFDFRGDL